MASRERRRNLARKCAASMALYFVRMMLTISSVQSLQKALSGWGKSPSGSSDSQRTQGLSSDNAVSSFLVRFYSMPVRFTSEKPRWA